MRIKLEKYKKLILCGLILTIVFKVYALGEVDSLISKCDYKSAEFLLEKQYNAKPYDRELSYKLGVCYLHLNKPQLAIKQLKLATERNHKAYEQLGDAYCLEYRFEDALRAYDRFLNSNNLDSITISINTKIDQVNMAIQMLTAVEKIQIIDSAVVSKHSFFKTYKLTGSDIGELYSVIEEDSMNNMRSTGYISPRKDVKLFSDTIDGNLNIFTSYKLIDGWSDNQELSVNINTPYNENYPFIGADGITIYFSSDNPLSSIGGYDIFIARYNNEFSDYMLPENIGMPYNSPYNDYLMVIDEQKNIGWFASDRFQDIDSVIIYQFILNNKREFIQDFEETDVIKAAKLKNYSLYKESLEEPEEVLSVPVSHRSKIKTMHFVINDTTVYSSVNQFTDYTARESYKVAIEVKRILVAKEENLERMRKEYAITESDENKTKLMAQIRSLEAECTKIRSLPEEYFKKSRNLEIKSLMKKE